MLVIIKPSKSENDKKWIVTAAVIHDFLMIFKIIFF